MHGSETTTLNSDMRKKRKGASFSSIHDHDPSISLAQLDRCKQQAAVTLEGPVMMMMMPFFLSPSSSLLLS
jgi:hypothetical protein